MMMQNNRIVSGVAGVLLAASALAGCVVAEPTPTKAPQPGASTPTGATAAPTAGSSSSDGGSAGTASSPAASDGGGQSTKAEKATVKLDPKVEGATQYMYAHQAFSPELEVWDVNRESGQLHYTRYTCAGTVDAESGATLAPVKDDIWAATWESESPMMYSSGATERLPITDTEVAYGQNVATTDTDAVLQTYVGKCAKAGKELAGFVL